MKNLKNHPKKLLRIGPDHFFPLTSQGHSPQPKIDFPYHEISGPDICSLICGTNSAFKTIGRQGVNQFEDIFQILAYFLLRSNSWTRNANLADKQSLSSKSESSVLSFLLDFSFFFLRLFDKLLFLSKFGDDSNIRLPELKGRNISQIILSISTCPCLLVQIFRSLYSYKIIAKIDKYLFLNCEQNLLGIN